MPGSWAGLQAGNLSALAALALPACLPAAFQPLTACICKLLQVTYPAELAGLHYGVRATVAGLLITVYGYSDTLPTLAQVGGWGGVGLCAACGPVCMCELTVKVAGMQAKCSLFLASPPCPALPCPAPPRPAIQIVLERALGFTVLPDRFAVVKEKKQKEFSNMK